MKYWFWQPRGAPRTYLLFEEEEDGGMTLYASGYRGLNRPNDLIKMGTINYDYLQDWVRPEDVREWGEPVQEDGLELFAFEKGIVFYASF